MARPFYYKYQTNDDRCFLYDVMTGRILEVSPEVYGVVDDYGQLSPEESAAAHPEFDHERVRKAYHEIDAIRQKGILADTAGREPSDIRGVVFEGKEYSLADFFATHSDLLMLGITERCNLRCDYCCYGENNDHRRHHSGKSMSWDTTRQAIDAILKTEQPHRDYTAFTFYGR